MIFRLPEINDKDILMDYLQEYFQNNETSITASMDLESSNYNTWLEMIKTNALLGDKKWGRSLLYLCFDKDILVGLLSIRYELNKDMSEIYGDIGYGVRPSKRRQGYATSMLDYGLSICKEKGMKEVILGCYKDNIASSSTIRKCGGILYIECDNYQPGRMSQYYKIIL